MKILSYEIDGERIRITTDNPGRPGFVYSKDKFNNLEELKKEIEASIAGEAKRKAKKDKKVNKVISELEDEKKKK